MSVTNVRRITGLAIIIASLIASAAQADVDFIVSAANLQDGDGVLAPTDSIALLVVDTGGDGFSQPIGDMPLSPGSSWGNDRIVGRWDLSSLNTAGQLLNITNVTYGGGISAGQSLALYWFPHKTAAATIVGCQRYGIYTNGAAIDGSDPWVLPPDAGNVVQLNFYTASRGGSNSDSAGRATLGTLTPTDPSQFISTVTLNVDGTNVVLTFTTHPFVYYDVQSSTDLVSGSWSSIATNLQGSGSVITNSDVGAATAPQRFYRLHEQ